MIANCEGHRAKWERCWDVSFAIQRERMSSEIGSGCETMASLLALLQLIALGCPALPQVNLIYGHQFTKYGGDRRPELEA